MAKKPATPKSSGDITASTTLALLLGQDLGLQSERLAEIKNTLEAAHGEIEQFRFDGTTATPAEVLDECRSFGLMSGHKLIVVDDADRFLIQDHRPPIERYCEAPSDGATLVLRAPGLNTPKLVKLIAANDNGVIRECNALSIPQAVSKLKDLAKAERASIDRDAAELLVARVGTDLGRLTMETAKLATAASAVDPKAPVITADLIYELAGEGFHRDDYWFRIKSAIATGNPDLALRTTRDIIDNAPSNTAVALVMSTAQFAVGVHAAATGVAGFPLKKATGLWSDDHALRALTQATKRVGGSTTIDLMDDAIDADRRCKSGLGNANRTMERIALRLASSLSGSNTNTRRR
ncbi:MAG: DNA polymerase III subunit delta [Planctomycetota bacterium]